jgi:phosphatidylinositol alpha-mannosyltransferase
VVELHALGPRAPAALRAADGIVAASEALRARIAERHAPRAPLEAIPNGFDPGAFAPLTGEGPPRLVYAGQLYPRKGVETLLRALRELPGVPALVIGGPEAECLRLRAQAAREGVAERVEFAGRVAQREIAGRLRRSDVAVVPTRASHGQEIGGVPLKLVELMACGLAVAASDLPSIRGVLRDGVNGRLFPEGDAGALARCARELLADAALRRRLGESARADAAGYTWEERGRRILAFLARLG